jgi:hypothetical protein
LEPDQRQEQEFVLDTYLSALGMLEQSGADDAGAGDTAAEDVQHAAAE